MNLPSQDGTALVQETWISPKPKLLGKGEVIMLIGNRGSKPAGVWNFLKDYLWGSKAFLKNFWGYETKLFWAFRHGLHNGSDYYALQFFNSSKSEESEIDDEEYSITMFASWL